MHSRRTVMAGIGCAVLGGPAVALAQGAATVDVLGRRVILARRPERVVALFPAMAELVFALGVGPRVAAVGGGVNYPPEAAAKPSVGGRLGFSPEAMIAARPDIVVMGLATQAPGQLLRPLDEAGVPVLVLDYPRLDSILRNVRVLGHMLYAERGAAALEAEMRGAFAAVERAVANRSRPRIFLETGAAGRALFQTVKAGHYADDAIRIAGGVNAFSTMRGPAQVSTEGLIMADPDRIVVLSSDPTATPRSLAAARPGWTGLRAVREGRLTVVPRGFMLIPGPRQAEAVRILARAIHPEAFATEPTSHGA